MWVVVCEGLFLMKFWFHSPWPSLLKPLILSFSSALSFPLNLFFSIKKIKKNLFSFFWLLLAPSSVSSSPGSLSFLNSKNNHDVKSLLDWVGGKDTHDTREGGGLWSINGYHLHFFSPYQNWSKKIKCDGNSQPWFEAQTPLRSDIHGYAPRKNVHMLTYMTSIFNLGGLYTMWHFYLHGWF